MEKKNIVTIVADTVTHHPSPARCNIVIDSEEIMLFPDYFTFDRVNFNCCLSNGKINSNILSEVVRKFNTQMRWEHSSISLKDQLQWKILRNAKELGQVKERGTV